MKPILSIALLILFAIPAQAIVIRHDREDESYRQLAQPFDSVCRVGGGCGTLIAPEWVLTAAHVAEGIAKGDTVTFENAEATVAERFIHPDYALADRHRDLALVRLTTPVESVTPTDLYREHDEAGQLVTLVGTGKTGNGQTGPNHLDRILRAATNRVTQSTPGWIAFTFDAPPDAEDLEGISGPGDSGGPALILTEHGYQIAGISAYNDGEPHCTYGTTEYYSRVSDELDWIEGVMAGRVGRAQEPRLMNYGTNEDGAPTVTREPAVAIEITDNSDLWDAVASLTTAINENNRDLYLSLFTPDYIKRQQQAGDPVDSMFDFMQGARDAFGPISTFHQAPTEGMQINDSRWPMRPVIFHLENGKPGYLGIAVDDHGKIDHLSIFVQGGICEQQAACTSKYSLAEARTKG